MEERKKSWLYITISIGVLLVLFGGLYWNYVNSEEEFKKKQQEEIQKKAEQEVETQEKLKVYKKEQDKKKEQLRKEEERKQKEKNKREEEVWRNLTERKDYIEDDDNSFVYFQDIFTKKCFDKNYFYSHCNDKVYTITGNAQTDEFAKNNFKNDKNEVFISTIGVIAMGKYYNEYGYWEYHREKKLIIYKFRNPRKSFANLIFHCNRNSNDEWKISLIEWSKVN